MRGGFNGYNFTLSDINNHGNENYQSDYSQSGNL